MIESLALFLSPFILNFFTWLINLLANARDTGTKRFVLAILSILGVLIGSAINGTPIDPVSFQGLLQTLAIAFIAFISAHGSYHLFMKKTPVEV